MTSKTTDSSSQVLPQGENAVASAPQTGPPDHQSSRARNQVFKSGPLFISSKGIGWTSWKKRWFILTRTSLVFFRSDPSAAPQKGGEVNLTLGGIDLNNTASVEVKADKKLLTVFFPDGRDGRAFTLKAETLEDLHEWKTALENALAVAPSATHGAGQNGMIKNEQGDANNGSADQQKDKPAVKSMVIGRPILLALEDIDGSPSFLEKALRFMEDYGVKVEGILRQAADVDDVHRRVREYEQGKTDFTAEEDAHVIADCIKYILRELPSSPVPASCCNALLEAFRTDRNNRLNAMHSAILETFPEPNRRLLQRILQMMQTVALNKSVNRMSTSAVAACMSPLLLRPLLAGDCELENTHMDVAGDGSFQLLQAAAAANHAQAIIITLLEEYDNIFGEGSMSAELFSDSDESGTGTEEATDDDMYDDDDDYIDDDDEDDDHEYASDDPEEETDNEYEHSVTETCSESGDHGGESDSFDEKNSRASSFSKSPERADIHLANQRSPSGSPRSPVPQNDNRKRVDGNTQRDKDRSVAKADDSGKSHRDISADRSSGNDSTTCSPTLGSQMTSTKFIGSSQIRRPRWGRTSAKKNLSMESIDFSVEDEDDEIQRLEAAKLELQNRIVQEANVNAILHASLERRKKALEERRLALEKDVARLQEQLQREKDLRAALEAGPNISQLPSSGCLSEKTRVELLEIALAEENFNNLKQRFDHLGAQLNHQREQNATVVQDRENEIQEAASQGTTSIKNKDKQIKKSSNKNEEQFNNSMDGDDRDNEWKNESSSANKNQNQPVDSSRGGIPKFGWLPSNSSSIETNAPKSNSSTSKKSSSKGDGNSTTSALSKLTNRLNFLKERRNQIANELQNIDKGKGSSNQPALSPGKGKAPEPLVPSNSEKNQGSGGSSVQSQEDHTHQTSNSSAKEISTDSDNKDSNKKSDSKRNTSSKSESSHSSAKGSSKEGDNKDGTKKSDNKKGSSSKSDAPPSHSSVKGVPNEGDYKDGVKKADSKDNKDGAKKGDNKDNKDGAKKADNKDNKKGSSTKSDAQSSYSSVKAVSSEGDSDDNNRKGETRDRKGFSSKSDASVEGRRYEIQSNQQFDRVKSEGQTPSRSSDKGRQPDGQQTNTNTSRNFYR